MDIHLPANVLIFSCCILPLFVLPESICCIAVGRFHWRYRSRNPGDHLCFTAFVLWCLEAVWQGGLPERVGSSFSQGVQNRWLKLKKLAAWKGTTCVDFKVSSVVGDRWHWDCNGAACVDHSALWSNGLVRALCGCSMRRCLHSMHR